MDNDQIVFVGQSNGNSAMPFTVVPLDTGGYCTLPIVFRLGPVGLARCSQGSLELNFGH